MALKPEDIAVVSKLLDQALALPVAEREAWLAALPVEHKTHAQTLRDMLAQEAELDTDTSLASLPTLPADESVAHAGDRVGPYRLIREIGRGGMGSVWLAERADGSYRRQLALKLPRLAWGAGLAERMARERDIGALLEHPNIGRLYDAGVDERGRPYLALEFVDGQPIDAWCAARGLSVRDRLKLFVQVARAVAYAHGRLVVHRDLKPSNVLVTADGQAHLLDFGIAKLLHEAVPGEAGLTQEQGRVLTPHYASPEQVAGEAITVQSDVYSLGVLLYELLTGVLPIAAGRKTLGAVEAAILEGDAPLASRRVKDVAKARALRGEVDAILAKAMQREPARRYATADALAQDIERHLQGETVSARPDSVAYRLRKAARRNWVGLSAVAAVLVAVLIGSGVAVVQAQRAVRAAERERVVKQFVADVFRTNSRIDPKNAELRPATPQALIENGAQLIQKRFAGEPALQAELFGVVGGLFSDMGAYKLAAEYATRRLEALTAALAEPDELAKGLVTLGQALFDDRRYADAEARTMRALALSQESSEIHLEALVLLARVQYARSQREALAVTLSQIDSKLAASGPGPSATRSWSIFLRAVEMNQDDRFDEALPLIEQAIDMAVMSEGPLSLVAIEQRIWVTFRLVASMQTERAVQQFDLAISALRQLGPGSEVRAVYLTAMFAADRAVGFNGTSSDQALATLDSSRKALADSELPIPPRYVRQIDAWRLMVMSESGRALAASKLLEAVGTDLLQDADTIGVKFQLMTMFGIATQLIGRHDRADAFFRESVALRREAGGANHPYAAFNYMAIANNLMMWGHFKDAEAALEEAQKLGQSTRGDGTSPTRIANILAAERALIWLAQGRRVEAVELLRVSVPAAEDDPDDWREYRAYLGEALCAVGKYGEGLDLLKQAVAADEPLKYTHAPSLARRRALIGLCAAGLGDRSVALRYAALARENFVAQSQVSPYFKTPLFALERALGLKKPPV